MGSTIAHTHDNMITFDLHVNITAKIDKACTTLLQVQNANSNGYVPMNDCECKV